MLKRLLVTVLLLYSYPALCQVDFSTAQDLTKLIAQGGDSALLLFRRAEAYYKTGNDSLALADIELIRASDPKLLYAANRLKVDVLAQLQRIDEAIQLSKDLTIIDPSDADLRFKLANMFLYSRDLKGALDQYSWLIEKYPNEPIGYSMHATTMMMMQNVPGMKTDLELLEKFDKDSLRNDVVEQMSMLYNTLGEYNKAKTYSEIALQRDSSAAAFALKGWALWGLKSYQEAVKVFTKSISIQPQPNAYLYRGKSYFALRFYTKAEIDLRKCIEMNPNSEDAYAFLGYVYQKRGNMKDACDCWRKGLKIAPKSDLSHDVEVYCK